MQLKRWHVGIILLALVISARALLTQAADHGDVPIKGSIERPDASITDLHTFVVGSNLVLALSTNPAIPPTVDDYIFPSDVQFELNIDTNADVDTTDDPFGNGGIITNPRDIDEEITFRITFRDGGAPSVESFVRGSAQSDPQIVSVFTGLRDDPFILRDRKGRNIAAIVLEVSLASIISEQSTLLIWATSNVQGFEGPQQEITGRALRSMFQTQLNFFHPKRHSQKTDSAPDVVIYDTSQPASYPNGRALKDDVVDLACDLSDECTVFDQRGEGSRGPEKNDVKFLSSFPYLAPPR